MTVVSSSNNVQNIPVDGNGEHTNAWKARKFEELVISEQPTMTQSWPFLLWPCHETEAFAVSRWPEWEFVDMVSASKTSQLTKGIVTYPDADNGWTNARIPFNF